MRGMKSVIDIPTVIDPPDTIFICVAIPDDPGHKAAFLGAMLWLTKWVAWDRTIPGQAKATAAVWKPIYECILEQVP